METSNMCAKVINLGFDSWTVNRKRMELARIIQRFVELHQPYTTINTCFI